MAKCFSKGDQKAMKALLAGADPIAAYTAGYPLANNWRKETVAKKAIALFTEQRISEYREYAGLPPTQNDVEGATEAYNEAMGIKKEPKKQMTPPPKKVIDQSNIIDSQTTKNASTQPGTDPKIHNLTEIQELFCHEFVVDMHGQNAAIRAGYAKKSAKVKASQLLAMPEVQRKVAELKRDQFKRIAVSADDIVMELVKCGFRDFRTMFDSKGKLVMPDKMDEHVAASVDSYEIVVKPTINKNGEKDVEHVHKIKLVNKLNALEMLAKNLGMFKDTLEITGKDEGPILIEGDMTPERALEIYTASLGK